MPVHQILRNIRLLSPGVNNTERAFRVKVTEQLKIVPSPGGCLDEDRLHSSRKGHGSGADSSAESVKATLSSFSARPTGVISIAYVQTALTIKRTPSNHNTQPNDHSRE